MPTNERRPFYNKYGWTQRINYFCNCADNRYDSLQAKLTGRSGDVWLLASYTLQRIRQDGAEQFFYDRELQWGRPTGRASTTSRSPPCWSFRSGGEAVPRGRVSHDST